MYIEAVPNRTSPPAILLRESYRDGDKVRKRTLLNLTDWPADLVAGFRALLKGGTIIPSGQDALTLTRALPHGHVAAALGTVRQIGLDRLLGPDGNRCRDLVQALIVSRITAPASKLATAKALDPMTAASSLGWMLKLGPVDEDELDTALDWLLVRQPAIEAALARRHLKGGTLVLYDVSSSDVEGRCGPLAERGDNRDRKTGTLQIVYGLLCAPAGCAPPTAARWRSRCSKAAPATRPRCPARSPSSSSVKQRFGVAHVVLVGDRGLITQARITEDVQPAGLDWITALRAPQIKALVAEGCLQLSLFDTRDLAAVTSPEFPGERLIVCRNPDLALMRGRQREELLAATERGLTAIAAAVARKTRPVRGTAEIGLRVGAVIGKHKMAKHFDLTITDSSFGFARKTQESAAEAALDGLYVIRTSLPAEQLDDTGTVRAYKSLAFAERAFRCIKTVDLQVRPIDHGLADRVRAHVCLCMLAYYVEWHMRARLAPMLDDEADKEAAEAARTSIVAPAQRSPAAMTKQTTGRPEDGLPVHSFQSLLADLATLTRNTMITALAPDHPFTLVARPTPIQRKAFDLLGVTATCTQ